jgi:hypothetical protein
MTPVNNSKPMTQRFTLSNPDFPKSLRHFRSFFDDLFNTLPKISRQISLQSTRSSQTPSPSLEATDEPFDECPAASRLDLNVYTQMTAQRFFASTIFTFGQELEELAWYFRKSFRLRVITYLPPACLRVTNSRRGATIMYVRLAGCRIATGCTGHLKSKLPNVQPRNIR